VGLEICFFDHFSTLESDRIKGDYPFYKRGSQPGFGMISAQT
jgi:hypothetical protein